MPYLYTWLVSTTFIVGINPGLVTRSPKEKAVQERKLFCAAFFLNTYYISTHS
jgi:hypothetical protein